MVAGTLVPSTATAFLMPYLRRVMTSARPSTMMMASESRTFGPAGIRSGPISLTFSIRRESRTSSRSTVLSMDPSSNRSMRSSFARSTIILRFVTRISSIFSTDTWATHGPTRSMVSREAARMAVSARSRDEAMRISPFVSPFLLAIWTSIRPTRPVLWRSRRSRSSPSNPSVWPKMAPTTSDFSTTPSA